MAIAKGTAVRQVITIIEGTVEKYEVDQTTGELQYLVVWADADGNEQSKYFKELEITPV